MNGTAGILDTIWNGVSYDKSAHVMEISWRFKPDRASRNLAEDFIATHLGFEHPDVVLQRTVSLYAVTPSEAVFVVVPVGVNLYSCKETPLCYVRQHEEAVKIIRMPLSSFHRLADIIGDPDDKTVVLLHFLTRSGSTLLMQILSRFHAEKDTICISETSPDSQLISDRDKYTAAEFKCVFRSTFRLLCKEPASLIAMKTSNPDFLEFAPLIKETFPKIYQLFSYRNALPMNRSQLVMYSQLQTFKLMYFTQKSPLHAWLLRLPRERMLRDYYGDKMYQQLRGYLPNFTMYQTICIHTAIQLKTYQSYVSNGVGVRGVWYKDIKTEPRAALGKILDHIALAEYSDQIPEMLKAMEEDSHGTNSLQETKRSAADHNNVLPVDSAMPAIISEMDDLCSAMELPLLSRQHPLEGTITNTKAVL
ncbi:uncharacterized protein LOC135489657 [Lineus longissimus]|uniref:uncharacterized protein LOC135489657 n=1 Tax=Lineus longissimus TaxID=88925 RepID=UPI00315CA78F